MPNSHASGTEVSADARFDGVSEEFVSAEHLRSLHFQNEGDWGARQGPPNVRLFAT